ncbi:hypothetical protein [Streptomyces sp. NPDC059906]|uniref:hypothetical protein n=1 Tax=Streptomyces sp. NPDC059906 TaxID=3346997 RepID=UPI003654D1A8
MRTWVKSTVVATSAAVTAGLMAATPATAAGTCAGGFDKNLRGVGRVTYSICTKTGDSGQPLRKVQGRLYDTRSDSASIKLTVTLHYRPNQTGEWSWRQGDSAGSKGFETSWRVANDQIISLEKV